MPVKLNDYAKLRPLTRRELYDLARESITLSEFGFQHPAKAAAKHRLEAYNSHVTFTQRLMHLADVTSFSYNHNLKPYGGEEATVMPMPHFWSVEGMDPAHMKLVLYACPDDCYESVEDVVTNAGYSLMRVNRGDSYEEALRYRPTHHAVMVNFAGYRDRSDHRWLYMDDKALDDLWGMEMLSGCARGHKELLRQMQAKAHCKAMAAHVRAVFAEETVTMTLTARVLWREEEVGSASMGGIQIKPWGDTDHGRRLSEGEQLCSAFLDTGIIEDAMDEAKVWADSAVAQIAEQVTALTQSVALLPERSRSAAEALYEAQVLQLKRGRSTPGRKAG